MGSVYRARDLHFPNVVKRVAVKEMVNQVRDPAMRETIIRNFEREANILATLEHPNIPRIFDYFTQNDRSYLILEFVEGKDLESLLNDSQGFFPEEQVKLPPWSPARTNHLSRYETLQRDDLKPRSCHVGGFRYRKNLPGRNARHDDWNRRLLST